MLTEVELLEFFRQVQKRLKAKVLFGEPCNCTQMGEEINIPYTTFAEGLCFTKEEEQDGFVPSHAEILNKLQQRFIDGLSPKDDLILRGFPKLFEEVDFITGNRLVYFVIRFHNKGFFGTVKPEGAPIMLIRND